MENWPDLKIPITNLVLDSENTRIPRSDLGQQELIQDLVEFEDVYEIAKSIVNNGFFPSENLIVIQSNKKNIYTVLEGNRRIAALKVLFQPEILIGSSQKKFQALSKNFLNKIIEVRTVLAPSREDAEIIIANIHTHNYRRKWAPLRQAYFYKQKIDAKTTIEELISSYPGVDIKRFISMLDMHHIAKSYRFENQEADMLVHNERAFPITTLERMYDSPDVRKFLGIEFDKNGKVNGKISKKEFSKGFKKIVKDITEGTVDSRTMSKSHQRKKYLKEFSSVDKPNVDKKGFFLAENFEVDEMDFDKGEHEKKVNKKRSKRLPKGLIPSGITFNLDNSSLQELFIELKKIDVKKCPNATGILFCSFLERSLHQFFIDTKVIKVDQKVSLEKLMNLVNSNKSGIQDPKAIEAAKRNTNKMTDLYSTYSMNAVKHNKDFSFSEETVRNLWNNFEALIKLILNPSTNSNG